MSPHSLSESELSSKIPKSVSFTEVCNDFAPKRVGRLSNEFADLLNWLAVHGYHFSLAVFIKNG